MFLFLPCCIPAQQYYFLLLYSYVRVLPVHYYSVTCDDTCTAVVRSRKTNLCITSIMLPLTRSNNAVINGGILEFFHLPSAFFLPYIQQQYEYLLLPFPCVSLDRKCPYRKSEQVPGRLLCSNYLDLYKQSMEKGRKELELIHYCCVRSTTYHFPSQQ